MLGMFLYQFFVESVKSKTTKIKSFHHAACTSPKAIESECPLSPDVLACPLIYFHSLLYCIILFIYYIINM